MKIQVVCKDIENMREKWGSLWVMLDGAKDAGIEYDIDEGHLSGYDSYIWIDNDEPNYNGKPYIKLSSLLDTYGTIHQKIQELASYMSGKKEWMTPLSHVNALVDEANDPEAHEFTIDVADLGYQVTPEEVATIAIKEFVVNIEGKEVSIGREDMVALGKVANLMDKFGYRIKKVVV